MATTLLGRFVTIEMLTHACKSYFLICDFHIPLERDKSSELDGEEGSIVIVMLILHSQLIVDIIICLLYTSPSPRD